MRIVYVILRSNNKHQKKTLFKLLSLSTAFAPDAASNRRGVIQSCVLLLLCMFAPQLSASAFEPRQAVIQVSYSFTWKNLIKYHKGIAGTDSASVRSEFFYLSDPKHLNPLDELDATIKAFAENQIINDVPAACRFPARYLWLGKELPERASQWEKPECPELDRWTNFDDLQGISLIQVSGYFGNPASAFGHLLLQVNREGSSGVRGLQDIGVNFGATVPDDEPVMSYIFKGLFGSYDAGFSNQDFYIQDHVYSAREFRDMWSYDVKLTPFQEKIILFHIWELKDAKFSYYFLKTNCAYHLAKLMEIAYETDFALNKEPVYLPVSLFHKLNDLDAESSGENINGIEFIPSAQREVHIAFEELQEDDKRLANRYVAAKAAPALAEDASSALLEFLLKYSDYKIQVLPKDEREDWEARRTEILLARLKAPAGYASPVLANLDNSEILERYKPPATGPRTRKIGLGLGVDEDGLELSTIFAPFAYDVLNRNTASLIDSTFKLGETTLNFKQGEVLLEKFEFISIEKLSPPLTSLHGEKKLNWSLSIGAKHLPRVCDKCLTPNISGGLGRVAALNSRLNVYGFALGELNRLGIDAGVSVGVFFRSLPNIRTRVELKVELQSDGLSNLFETVNPSLSVSSLIGLTRDWDITTRAELWAEGRTAALFANYRW